MFFEKIKLHYTATVCMELSEFLPVFFRINYAAFGC